MKSLHKTFDILEFVFLQEGRNVTPNEIAEYTGLNAATCTRILAELVERGYLDKVSRRDGYRPGPMAAALNNRENCYRRLVRAAEPGLRVLSEAIGMPVNLSVMHGTHRVMVKYCNTQPRWSPWAQFFFDEHLLASATGRLLLATLPEAERNALCDSFPLPEWPEIADEVALAEACERICAAREVCFYSAYDTMIVAGGLLLIPEYPAAAIGFGIADAARESEILALLRRQLRDIESVLSGQSPI